MTDLTNIRQIEETTDFRRANELLAVGGWELVKTIDKGHKMLYILM
ncbi:hypothetical protein [Paenibacillus mesophilus]|nr:hypothetical protein [Paenibacillus mesophilus]